MLEQSLRDHLDAVRRADTPARGVEGLFHRLLDKLPAGAYTCDAGGLITYFNQHAERLWGRAPRLNDPVDRYCGSFKLHSPDGVRLMHDQCWMALALQMEKEYHGHEIIIEQPDGTRITALAHASPIHDESGRLLGAVNVLVDISDRKRVEDALKEADGAKSEFLATMSHEIRTPINAIIGYVDLLDVEVAGPLTEGQRSHLRRIQAASRHLLSLVTDVLDLSKVEARRMMVRRESRRVGDTVEAALAVMQPLAAAKGIALADRSGANLGLTYDGDEDRVRQTLINLLSNAIKFSEPGSRVELTCSLVKQPDVTLAQEANGGPWVCIRIRDWGIGIPPDQLERIFEPFVQVEATRTRTRGGTGLGLTITRRLARLMGGDLTVESAVGEGSVFRLWLPAAQTPSVSEQSSDDLGTAARSSSPAHAFTSAGQTLLGGLDEILRTFVERLRAEEVGPGSAALSTAQLANHAGTLLADIAVTLLALEDGGRTPASFAAGAEIQRVCAIEHGRQRGHLGWTEADITREYHVLLDEIVQRLRAPSSAPDPHVDNVIGTIRRQMELARMYSVRGMQSVAVRE
ncbi:MAG TPA: ATP-binding protein [Gemmatimonadaceae bacterium]|nr:ATP-binding protein [Gemmatimonadaceae bacterium]